MNLTMKREVIYAVKKDISYIPLKIKNKTEEENIPL